MTSEELTKKLRHSEFTILIAGIAVALVLLFIWFKTEKFYFSAFLGYYLGCLSFIILVEGFLALEKAPTWLRIPTLVLSNLKLFLLLLLVYGLHRLGFSVIEVASGIFASQLVVVFMIVRLYCNRNAARQA